VCETLAAEALSLPELSLDAAIANLPLELGKDATLQQMLDRFDAAYSAKLPPRVSPQLARDILNATTQNPALSPLLAKVAHEYKDTKQFVLEVLSVGAALSMIIVSACGMRIDIRAGKFTVVKGDSTKDQAMEITNWLDTLKSFMPRELATGNVAGQRPPSG